MMKVKNLILILFLFFVNVSVVNAGNLTIMPIDANDWGDSALLESSGEYLLIDATYGNTTNVLDFLINKNVKKFSLYLSHYHGDHIGSENKLTIDGKQMELMEYLIRNQNKGNYKNHFYTINTLYIPNPKVCEISGESSCLTKYNSLKNAANEMGVNVVLLDTGSTFTLGNTTANVLYMNTDASDFVNAIGSKANNCSLVTRFTNGNVKFLTAGDIEKVTEEKILKLGIDVSADIFKLNHHGLHYKNELSNNSGFVKAVNPKYSYVQFTENNKWSYKYQAIKTSIDYLNISSYYNLRSNMYNTDVNGNIQFVIKDNQITPISEKGVYQVKINYVDQDTNQKLSTKTYDFSYSFYGYELQYYLYDYEKSFPGYELGKTSDLKQTGVLTGNTEYNIYYKKIKPTKITLSTNVLELKVGESKNVQITKVEPTGVQCQSVTWSSSNKSVASVSSGNIQGLMVGNATVTVSCDGITSKIGVTVKSTTTNKTMTLIENKSTTLTASSAVKEWKSSNTTVATITQKGELKAIKPGTVTITANLVNGNKDVWTVTINKKPTPTKITLSANMLELKVGETKNIKITNVEPSGVQCQNVTWSSSNKSVASVSSGNIQGLMVGNATVTVNCDGVISKINVTVKETVITETMILVENESIKLAPVSTVKEWKTSNKEIATITQKGELTAKKPGTVTITANLVNGNKHVWTVTVNKKSGLTKVMLSVNSVELKVGETKNVQITKVEPEGAQCKSVVWTSTNKNIATVVSGNVEAVAVGETTITVNCDGIISTVNVTVKSTTINRKMTLVDSESTKLTASSTVKEWKTSNKKVATVNENGELKVLKPGTVTITANLVNGNKEVWKITITKQKDDITNEKPILGNESEENLEKLPEDEEQEQQYEMPKFNNNYIWLALIVVAVVITSIYLAKQKPNNQ